MLKFYVMYMEYFYQCNGQEILWKHVVDLYYHDTSLPYKLRQVPKLKYEHINLTSYSKMRVDLAAQVNCVTLLLLCITFSCWYASLGYE